MKETRATVTVQRGTDLHAELVEAHMDHAGIVLRDTAGPWEILSAEWAGDGQDAFTWTFRPMAYAGVA